MKRWIHASSYYERSIPASYRHIPVVPYARAKYSTYSITKSERDILVKVYGLLDSWMEGEVNSPELILPSLAEEVALKFNYEGKYFSIFLRRDMDYGTVGWITDDKNHRMSMRGDIRDPEIVAREFLRFVED